MRILHHANSYLWRLLLGYLSCSAALVGCFAGVLAACGAANPGTRDSPIWMPEARPNVFCDAWAHTERVLFEPIPQGGILRFEAKVGQEEALLRALSTIVPTLTSDIQQPNASTEKWRTDTVKAHGGGLENTPPTVHDYHGSRAPSSSHAGLVTVKIQLGTAAASLVVIAANPSDVGELQAHLKRHTLHLSNGTCDWVQVSFRSRSRTDHCVEAWARLSRRSRTLVDKPTATAG